MDIINMLKGDIAFDEFLNYNNASIIYEWLPKKIKGFIFNYDNINFIIINKNLSNEKMKETILHELAHLELNQLNQIDKDLFTFKVDKYEDETDKYINVILEYI